MNGLTTVLMMVGMLMGIAVVGQGCSSPAENAARDAAMELAEKESTAKFDKDVAAIEAEYAKAVEYANQAPTEPVKAQRLRKANEARDASLEFAQEARKDARESIFVSEFEDRHRKRFLAEGGGRKLLDDVVSSQAALALASERRGVRKAESEAAAMIDAAEASKDERLSTPEIQEAKKVEEATRALHESLSECMANEKWWEWEECYEFPDGSIDPPGRMRKMESHLNQSIFDAYQEHLKATQRLEDLMVSAGELWRESVQNARTAEYEMIVAADHRAWKAIQNARRSLDEAIALCDEAWHAWLESEGIRLTESDESYRWCYDVREETGR